MYRINFIGPFVLACVAALIFGSGVAAQHNHGAQSQQSPAHSHSRHADAATDRDEEAKIAANLARLSPADRKLAEAQGFCAVQMKNRLGSMGAPVKVMVNEQPVFVCCNGCRENALASPDQTLANVATLKKKTAEIKIQANLMKLPTNDRAAAKAQGYCPVSDERLGSMGVPVKIVIGDQMVYLCCSGCKEQALSNPSATLKAAAESKAKVTAEAERKTEAAQPHDTKH